MIKKLARCIGISEGYHPYTGTRDHGGGDGCYITASDGLPY